MVYLNPITRLRLQCDVEHLHALGPRATAELLAEVGHRIGGMPCILSLLGEYRQRLTPEMIRHADADRFPPPPLHAVPSADARREAVR
jgi:hypothetical protein